MKIFSQFKTLILLLALSVTGARAEVMEVWSHSLENGDYAKNVKQYERLRPILENLGAYVEYYLEDIDGAPVSHFVVKFDDLRIWGLSRPPRCQSGVSKMECPLPCQSQCVTGQ